MKEGKVRGGNEINAPEHLPENQQQVPLEFINARYLPLPYFCLNPLQIHRLFYNFRVARCVGL